MYSLQISRVLGAQCGVILKHCSPTGWILLCHWCNQTLWHRGVTFLCIFVFTVCWSPLCISTAHNDRRVPLMTEWVWLFTTWQSHLTTPEPLITNRNSYHSTVNELQEATVWTWSSLSIASPSTSSQWESPSFHSPLPFYFIDLLLLKPALNSLYL